MQPAEINKIFTDPAAAFEENTLRVFHFQYSNNDLYRQFCDLLKKTPANVASIEQIPFLPISFFKTHTVRTTTFKEVEIFESSGTTGMTSSRHYVKDAGIYRRSYTDAFRHFYGDPAQYCFLALLPSYLERSHSSLVHMVRGLMDQSGHPSNGFFLHNTAELYNSLSGLQQRGEKIFLIGVTYALLDFADSHPLSMAGSIIMETGGMKGRKKEMIRKEVHQNLRKAFGVEHIHSEYGMTELLSQAYAKENGMFETASWMKVLVSDEDDPGLVTAKVDTPATGSINVIDLANIYSCSFIATEDVGRLYPGGKFEVLGRIDHTDIRGCSLLAP